ncbi:hypothetical protein PTKIN_Ptkin13bG0252800 [Pterospermum kingtungense]
MKGKIVGFICFLMFILLLLCSYTTSARLLQQNQDEKEFKASGMIIQAGLFTDAEEDFSNLMGSEECHEKDEECVKRRMIAEAHLDYIYTQHNKP